MIIQVNIFIHFFYVFLFIFNFYPGILVKSTHLENGKIWYHNKCSIVTQSKNRCNKCNFVIEFFGICKRRSLTQKNKSCVQPTLSSSEDARSIHEIEEFEEPIEID